MRFRYEGLSVNLGHADHGVTEEQLRWCLDSVLSEAHQGFLRRAWALPPELLGELRSGLWGPNVGDEPIPDSQCRWIVRGTRRCASRVVARPTRGATHLVLIGMVRTEIRLWTAYGTTSAYGTTCGVIAPREPGDLSIPTWNEIVEAREFWTTHALSLSEET